jgi:hypothetical protein
MATVIISRFVAKINGLLTENIAVWAKINIKSTYVLTIKRSGAFEGVSNLIVAG